MPIPRYVGCFVKLNQTTALAAGGYDGTELTKKTHFYSIPDGTWSQGPSLARGLNARCAVLEDLGLAGSRYVIIAGGGNNSKGSGDVQTQLWKIGSEQ